MNLLLLSKSQYCLAIVLWLLQWIGYYCYRTHKIVLWWSCDYRSTRLYLRTPSQFSSTLPCSPPFLIILNSWLKINSPEAWVEAINSLFALLFALIMRRNHKNHIESPCWPLFAFPFIRPLKKKSSFTVETIFFTAQNTVRTRFLPMLKELSRHFFFHRWKNHFCHRWKTLQTPYQLVPLRLLTVARHFLERPLRQLFFTVKHCGNTPFFTVETTFCLTVQTPLKHLFLSR